MNTELFLARWTWRTGNKRPWVSREFLVRVALVAVLVTSTELLPWHSLRFYTSEAVLRASAWLGMATARVSFDTIRVQQSLFRFVVPCTFVDVFAGSIPLIWDLKKSVFSNLFRMISAAAALFGFNVMRLEIGQIIYARGVAWVVADEVPSGLAYFAVWLVIWRLRSWEILTSFPAAPSL